jgi:ankyrin repeat protein
MLLKHGADVRRSDVGGKCSLMLACVSGHTATAEMLLKHGEDVRRSDRVFGWCSLMLACEYGHTATAEMLLKHGADVKQSNAKGWCSLTLACENGNTATAEMLLRHGADANVLSASSRSKIDRFVLTRDRIVSLVEDALAEPLLPPLIGLVLQYLYASVP